MPLELLPAEVADVPVLAKLIFSAFESDPLHVAMFPRENQEEYMDWYYAKLTRSILEEPFVHTIKVVDTRLDPPLIIGYGRWQFPERDDDQKVPHVQDKVPPSPFPTNANQRLVDDYVLRTSKARHKFVNPQTDYVLQMLATDPKHQKRGVGRLMMEYGLWAADKEGAAVFLEATPEAHVLYQKFGFRDLEDIELVLGDYGIDAGLVHKTTVMGRPCTKSR